MATLQTGQNRLQAIQRQRQLADALAQSAISYEPIQHPLQGAAKLAQAFVAAKMLKGATKKEDKIEQEERDRLAKAIDYFAPANKVTVPQQQEFLPGVKNTMLGGFDEDYRGIEMPVPDSFKDYSIPNPLGEMLKNMDPEMSNEILGQLTARQMMVGMGITPQAEEARYRAPGKLNKLGDYDVTMPNGQMHLGMPIYTDPAGGPPGFYGSQGWTPIDMRWASKVDRREEKTQLPEMTASQLAKFGGGLRETVTAMDQIERLRGFIMQPVSGLTSDSSLGKIRQMTANFIGFFRQASRTYTGYRRDEEKLVSFYQSGPNADRPTSKAYGDWDATMASYQQNVAAAEREGKDARVYSQWELDANRTFLNQFASLDARTQQVSIALAYTLARIADPGGRLSEMDVINQMRSLNLTAMDPAARMGALAEAERTFAVQAGFDIDFMRAQMVANKQDANALPIPMMPDGRSLEAHINDIRRGTWNQQTWRYDTGGGMASPQLSEARQDVENIADVYRKMLSGQLGSEKDRMELEIMLRMNNNALAKELGLTEYLR
jgi:hypothetical protein